MPIRQAAVFLENARLVGELRQAAAELEQRVEERTRQLEAKQAQVIQAEKMAAVGRLAGSLAHEVNNPLQAIMLHLQLLAEDELPATAALQLGIVRQEFDRIAVIVGRLLDFQRPQAECKQRVCLAQMLEDVLLLAGKQLQRAGIEVVTAVQSTLPPLLAVENQLKQVFLNLILNSIQAMPNGGCLDIRLWQKNNSVTITFTDEGDGLSEEALSQLFEPFFTTKVNGSGLGLAISHEIVANHGGIIPVNLSAISLHAPHGMALRTLCVQRARSARPLLSPSLEGGGGHNGLSCKVSTSSPILTRGDDADGFAHLRIGGDRFDRQPPTGQIVGQGQVDRRFAVGVSL